MDKQSQTSKPSPKVTRTPARRPAAAGRSCGLRHSAVSAETARTSLHRIARFRDTCKCSRS